MINSLYDNFKHWSEDGSVYIISDTHFDDPDCKFMNPNWPTAQEQVNTLNKYVHKTDTLIHLGDVGNIEWVKKLNCYKVLIMGNHDVGKSKYLRVEQYLNEFKNIEEAREAVSKGEIDCYESILGILIGKKDNKLFDEVYEGPLMVAEKLILSHEPIPDLTWCMNIHGHDHAGYITDWNHLNVASNICGHKPLNLGNLIKNGFLSDVKTLHRITIDRATENPIKKEKNI